MKKNGKYYDLRIEVRVSRKDLDNLDRKCKKLKKTRSELIREFMNESIKGE